MPDFSKIIENSGAIRCDVCRNSRKLSEKSGTHYGLCFVLWAGTAFDLFGTYYEILRLCLEAGYVVIKRKK